MVDRRVDVLRAEQRLEAGVAARLVREQVRPRVEAPVANPAPCTAVDRDADEVGERLGRRGRAARSDLRVPALEPLRRSLAEDLRHVPGRVDRVNGQRPAARVCLRWKCKQ